MSDPIVRGIVRKLYGTDDDAPNGTNLTLDTGERFHTGVVEPGNGGRYAYCVWRDASGRWYAAFPDYHAASPIGSGKHHWDYVAEKMNARKGDAVEMTKIINDCILGPDHETGDS